MFALLLALALGGPDSPSGFSGFQAKITHTQLGPEVSALGDLDADGMLDVVVGSNQDGLLCSYRGLGGGRTGAQEVLATGLWWEALELVDLDGDGDLDLVEGTAGGLAVRWGVGAGAFATAQALMGGHVRALAVADLDGDGQLDVVASGLFGVGLVRGLGGALFAPVQVLTTTDTPLGLDTGDLDGDGDVDLAWAEPGGDVAWVANLGGGSFGPEQVLQAGALGSLAIRAVDLDGDGDLDLVSAQADSGRLARHENLGAGSFASQAVLFAGEDGITDLAVADPDGDGDPDLFWSTHQLWGPGLGSKVRQLPNLGAGTFGAPVLVTNLLNNPRDLAVGDLTGDGVPELLVASRLDHAASWFSPLASGGFAPRQAVVDFIGVGGEQLADLDGDGDVDVLTLSGLDGSVRWYANLGGNAFGSPWRLDATTSGGMGFWSYGVGDLDGDGDVDVLTYLDGQKEWLENLGAGWFAPAQAIGGPDSGSGALLAADLDGDGRDDVLSAIVNTDQLFVAWSAASGPAWPEVALPSGTGNLMSVALGDLDGDGDLDVVLGQPSALAWIENLGARSFAPLQLLSTGVPYPKDLAVGDLDGDGDQDLVAVDVLGDEVTWLENLPGSAFAGPVPIGAVAHAVEVVDVDQDGDADLLAGSVQPGQKSVRLVESLGGGQFASPVVITSTLELWGATATADLDGDWDLDIVVAGSNKHHLSLLSNQLGPPDCDGNGVPDGLDLAQGTHDDCDGNGVPDPCDLLEGYEVDVDLDGQLDACVPPALWAEPYLLSVAAGGQQHFTLHGPAGGELYLLLGTSGGQVPGMTVGGFHVPLNPSPYLLHSLTSPNMPPLAWSLGVLVPVPSGGQAGAVFTLPPALDPALVGHKLHHAYVTLDLATGALTSASNSVPTGLLP